MPLGTTNITTAAIFKEIYRRDRTSSDANLSVKKLIDDSQLSPKTPYSMGRFRNYRHLPIINLTVITGTVIDGSTYSVAVGYSMTFPHDDIVTTLDFVHNGETNNGEASGSIAIGATSGSTTVQVGRQTSADWTFTITLSVCNLALFGATTSKSITVPRNNVSNPTPVSYYVGGYHPWSLADAEADFDANWQTTGFTVYLQYGAHEDQGPYFRNWSASGGYSDQLVEGFYTFMSQTQVGVRWRTLELVGGTVINIHY